VEFHANLAEVHVLSSVLATENSGLNEFGRQALPKSQVKEEFMIRSTSATPIHLLITPNCQFKLVDTNFLFTVQATLVHPI
jgi:hypothetical protein